MRVGVIAIQHESNTFLPTPTTLDLFRALHVLAGSAIRPVYDRSHHEVGGFFEGLDEAGIEAVPIFAASVLPSGTITAATCDTLLESMFALLAASGPLDGLLVAPHGAAVSDIERDFDGLWLSLLRAKVGDRMPIIGTLDPHANVSPRMVEACNALIAYRTNPHLDQRARGVEAARLMARTLRGEVRPTMGACFIPLAINIERQLTSASPCKELIALADAQRQQPGVLTNSVVLGFPYSDVQEMGTCLLAVTDNDRERAQQLADELGAYLWQHRQQFRGELNSIEQAIVRAGSSPQPVGLLDMGDNVGGGSPGDSTFLLHALVDARIASSLTCLYDPAAVEQALRAGIGQRVTLSIGGKTDDRHGAPWVGEATVLSENDGKFTETQVRHGGRTEYDQGRSVVVQLSGGQTVLLSSRRMVPFSIGQVTSCGLDPSSFQMIVIKGVHAPVAAYAPYCPTLIRVDTPGATRADMTQLDFTRRRQPLFPFEDGFDWQP